MDLRLTPQSDFNDLVIVEILEPRSINNSSERKVIYTLVVPYDQLNSLTEIFHYLLGQGYNGV